VNLGPKFYLSVGFMCLLSFALAGSALADPTGTASITNCTPGGGFTFSATTITWLPVAGTNVGCIATGLPTSISYSGGTFTSGTGTISDLPAGSINPFIVLDGGALDFSLTAFQAPTPTNGVCSTAVPLASGLSCIAFVGSPFLFISEGAETAVTLQLLGITTDTGDASTSPYTGLFTSQFGATTATIAAAIDNGGSLSGTYSGVLTVGDGDSGNGGGNGGGNTVPEPSSLLLLGAGLGLGLLMLAGLGRRTSLTRSADLA
jgi:hypothetical protein